MRKRRFTLLVPVVAAGLAALALVLALHGPPGAAQDAEPPFAYGVMRAVGAADNEIYPDEQVAITLHGGYAYHDNEKIITTGLPSVAVGSYAYFEGKEEDAHGNAITSWQWELIERPTYSEAALENADTQFPRLLTDKTGTYEVKVTATNELAETGSSTITVSAGTYVGVQQCATCHIDNVMPDMVTPWRETGHATKLETTYDSYTPERDYCIGCHITGYNETDQAEGFDDLALRSGWNPSEGSLTGYLKDGGWLLNWVMLSPMGALANIQCESCHGPGSIHTDAKSYDPGVCGQCHGQPEQWEYSGHAQTGYENLHTAESAGCVACHTGEGFVEVTMRGENGVFPYEATDEEPATLSFDPSEQPPIACATCHDPHQATYPDVENQTSLQLRYEGPVTLASGVTVDAGESGVCVMCHGGRRDATYKQDYLEGNKSRSVHHNIQALVFYGVEVMAFTFGNTLDSSAHSSVVEESCIQCHMAPNYVLDAGPDGEVGTRDDVTALSVGDHSWAVSGEWEGQELENVENACGSCHVGLTTFNYTARGDYDGDGQTEGIQDEVQGLLDLVAAELPQDDSGNVPSSGIGEAGYTEVERQGIWNYHVVADDGSKGVHNTAFAVRLLQITYKALTGQDVPGATLR